MLPKFSAEASLYSSSGHYRTHSFLAASPGVWESTFSDTATAVVLAQSTPLAGACSDKKFGDCVSRCRPGTRQTLLCIDKCMNKWLCPEGYACCSGLCIDVYGDDPKNCGDCGTPSGQTSACCNGVPYDISLQECCGAGVTCPLLGKSCCGGTCCPDTKLCCNGSCIDSSDFNCGSCGTNCLQNGLICCKGQCVDPSNNDTYCGGCQVTCGSGETCCHGSCVNLTDNSGSGQDCGTCGNICPHGTTCQSKECFCGSARLSSGEICLNCDPTSLEPLVAPEGTFCCNTWTCPKDAICCSNKLYGCDERGGPHPCPLG